jgi:hypothetical protein
MRGPGDPDLDMVIASAPCAGRMTQISFSLSAPCEAIELRVHLSASGGAVCVHSIAVMPN